MRATWLRICLRPGIALALFLAWSISGDASLSAAKNESAKIDPKLFPGLRYRNIGPHRGGRVTAVVGHRKQPHTFYMGAPELGVSHNDVLHTGRSAGAGG